MIKTLAAAAVLSLGLAGYAVAQETPPAPRPHRFVNHEPPMTGMHHHHHHYVIIITIIITHHMHAAPMAAPAPAPAQ